MKLKKLLTSIFATVASVCLAFGIGTLVTTEVKAEDAATTETTFTEADVTQNIRIHYWSGDDTKGHQFLINVYTAENNVYNILAYGKSSANEVLNEDPSYNGCDVMSYIQVNGVTLRDAVGQSGTAGSTANGGKYTSTNTDGFGTGGKYAPFRLSTFRYSALSLNAFELWVSSDYATQVLGGIENIEITVMAGIEWKTQVGGAGVNNLLKTTVTTTYILPEGMTAAINRSQYLDRKIEKVDITQSVTMPSSTQVNEKTDYWEIYGIIADGSKLTGFTNTWAPYCGGYNANSQGGRGVALWLNDNANTNGCDLASYIYLNGKSVRAYINAGGYTQKAQFFKGVSLCADGVWGGIRLQITKEWLTMHNNGALEGLEIALKTGFEWNNIDNKALYTTKDVTWKYKDGAFVDTFVSSASVSCQDSLDLNFYVTARDSVQAVTGTFNNATESVNGVFDSEKGMWKFTYSVAAKDFAQDVNLTLNNGKTWTTSVKDYLDSIIAESETNKAYEVASTLKAYCQAAQTYFAGEAATATDALTADLSAYKATQSGEQDGVAVQGATLVLEGKTHIRIYFTANDMTGVVCKVGESEVTPEALQDGRYVIMIENLTATELDTMYTISIGDMTITYGALSYVAVAHDDANVALANVVKALYAYSYAAEDYFKNN